MHAGGRHLTVPHLICPAPAMPCPAACLPALLLPPAVGNYLGTAAFKSRLLKREHITKTEQCYAKYGGKTGGWVGRGAQAG